MVYMSCEGYLTDLNIFKRIMIMELFFFFHSFRECTFTVDFDIQIYKISLTNSLQYNLISI